MDAYSSGGEEPVTKTRKPYTITKQRERWSEEEHNRFIEALKLYGRAWQRIEDHIGTKTAMQIRSHAQKFFSKLEKEAVAKGMDIDIPPPRPKRKPKNPYPRKIAVCSTKNDLNLGKQSLIENQIKPTENQDDNCSGVFGESDKSDSAKEDFIIKEKQHSPTQKEENLDSCMARESMQNNPFVYPAASVNNDQLNGRSPLQDSFPKFPPLLEMPSAFYSLVLSLLLQNPAAHAAASFAATFWHHGNQGNGGSQTTSPNMAAIVSSTLAAATAWWAAHGILPHCAPLHTAPPAQFPFTKADNMNIETQNHQLQDYLVDRATVLHPQNSQGNKLPKPVGEEESQNKEMAANTPDINDSTKAKIRKQEYRSSCGSNTSSSSEVEIDALAKNGEDNEDSKDDDMNQYISGDSDNHRGSATTSSSDSRKEVSEEGRLAFRALFSMEVLPQSFFPRLDLKGKLDINDDAGSPKERKRDRSREDLLLDLNASEETEKSDCGVTCDNGDEDLLRIELGHGKLDRRFAGFKPYKRCSVEAKDCRMTSSIQGEGKCSKRIRLEGDALT